MRYPLRLAALLLCAAPALADEIYVDRNGTGDTLTIQAAVDLAVDGDLVIVRPGDYPESVIVDGKSLWIVAQNEQGPAVTLRGSLRVENIDASRDVLLAGLQIFPETLDQFAQLPAMSVVDSAGFVRLQDVEITGASSTSILFAPLAGDGLSVENVRRLTLVRTVIVGGLLDNGDINGCGQGLPGVALQANSSSLAGWDLRIEGGAGGFCSGGYQTPTRGADGMVLTNSSAFLSGSSVIGGEGEGNFDLVPIESGDGGDGIRTDSNSRLIFVDTTSEGGAAGVLFGNGGGLGSPGDDGMAFAGAGRLRVFNRTAELRSTSRFVRGQSVQNIRVDGKPGTEVSLFISTSPRAPFLFDVSMGEALDLPRAPVPLGTIPASGVLNAQVGIPALPPTSTTTRFQFIIVSGSGATQQVFASPVSILAVNCDALLPDCNSNGRGDLCDLIEGTSVDLDGDGIPDDC